MQEEGESERWRGRGGGRGRERETGVDKGSGGWLAFCTTLQR
jgi:hypothetical protein